MDIDKHVKYWIDESMESLDTAKVLLDATKKLESAFFCNLACEKMLKAAFVKRTNQIPPKIHPLQQLAKSAAIYDDMSESQKDLLNLLDAFQIEGRYPQDRKRIYQTTPVAEFRQILVSTEEIIAWIHEKLI